MKTHNTCKPYPETGKKNPVIGLLEKKYIFLNVLLASLIEISEDGEKMEEKDGKF
jgi:hypothetical protein